MTAAIGRGGAAGVLALLMRRSRRPGQLAIVDGFTAAVIELCPEPASSLDVLRATASLAALQPATRLAVEL